MKSAAQGETVYIEGPEERIFELVLAALAAEGAPKAGIMRGKVKIAADLNDLPLIHRAPFDRLLIAQSLAEDLPIITNDTVFDAYQSSASCSRVD